MGQGGKHTYVTNPLNKAYEKNSTEAKKKEEPSEAGKLHDVVFELRRLNEDLKKTLLEKEGLTKQLEDNFTELKSQIDQQEQKLEIKLKSKYSKTESI